MMQKLLSCGPVFGDPCLHGDANPYESSKLSEMDVGEGERGFIAHISHLAGWWEREAG